MQYKILYKLTSRSRPQRFFATLDNIVNLQADKVNYEVLCSLDEDDTTMNTDEVRHRIDNYALFSNIQYHYGTSRNKIDAINRDMEKVEAWDILVNVSDDQLFNMRGVDSQLRQDFQEHFPDTDGVLHYFDGNRADLMTMSIMGKKYYERFNYIYHPSYVSLWCDNEACEVAQKLGKYKYVPVHLFTHHHPAYGKGQWDSQYAKTESYNNADRENYYLRRAINFELNTP